MPTTSAMSNIAAIATPASVRLTNQLTASLNKPQIMRTAPVGLTHRDTDRPSLHHPPSCNSACSCTVSPVFSDPPPPSCIQDTDRPALDEFAPPDAVHRYAA